MIDEGLFEEPTREPINVGDRVVLRTICGEVDCRVEALGTDVDGWPLVTVSTMSGERVTVNRASVRERP